jgi:hypothetical protein
VWGSRDEYTRFVGQRRVESRSSHSLPFGSSFVRPQSFLRPGVRRTRARSAAEIKAAAGARKGLA